MIKPLVSIIIPIYNKDEQHVKKCLDSIIHQSLKNIEIIAVNDGSTNGIEVLLNSYKTKEKRMIVHHQNNRGVSSARNIGISIASSPYIMFVDADDWIEENCCEDVYHIATNDNLDMVLWTYIKEYPGYSSIYKQNIKDRINIFDLTFMGSVCKILFKAELIKYERFNETLSNGEDVEFNFRIFKKAKSYKYINHPYYHYRILSNSAVRNSNKLMISNYNQTLNAIEKNCLNTSDYAVYYSFMSICFLMIILNQVLANNDTTQNKVKIIKNISKQYPYNLLKNNIKYIELPFTRKLPIYCMKLNLYYILYLICRIKKMLEKS